LMLFLNGPFGWPITKNIMKSPLSRNHIFSIILHLHVLFCTFTFTRV
jgi:hypothetical protein